MSYELPELEPDVLALLREPVEADEWLEGTTEGRVVDAVVHERDDENLYVKIGDDHFGRCALEEATPVGTAEFPETGSPVRCLLEEATDDTMWEVSLAKGVLLDKHAAAAAWPSLEQPVRGRINLVVRGGFMVEVDGLRCFLPGRESGIRRASSFAAVGTEFDFEVIRFDPKTSEPVLSRTRLAGVERKEIEQEIYASLEVGQVVEGTVSSVKPFGVFVDIGGVDGMCHVSELSLQHVEDPASLVRAGDRLTVTITSIDIDKGRIGLSRRDQLTAEQRDRVGELEVGSTIEGTVTRIADFGAFVSVIDDVEGLCHVSELSWTARVSHPSEVLSEGQTVQMKILAVETETGRVSLSLRALEDNPWATIETDHSVGSVVTGEITRIEDYGLFVKIKEGVEGLCHIGDLTWEGRPERPSDVGEFAVGDSIEVKVLLVDIARGRISLGIKQLSGDPWDDAGDRTTVGEIFSATVTRFDDRAAFLQVAEGLEGRLYIAEISEERIESIRSALRIGQSVEVMTVRADRERRRLDLSIKAVAAKIEAETPKSYSDKDAMNSMAAVFAASGLTSESSDASGLASEDSED